MSSSVGKKPSGTDSFPPVRGAERLPPRRDSYPPRRGARATRRGSYPPGLEAHLRQPTGDAEVIRLPTSEHPPIAVDPRVTGEIEGFRERSEETGEVDQVQADQEISSDYNVRLVGPAISYIGEKFGSQAVSRIARKSGVSESELKRGKAWLSHLQMETVLALIRQHCEDDDEFLKACSHKIRESWGPIVFLLRATTVQRIFDFAGRTMKTVCRVGHYETIESTRTSTVYRYYTEVPESRLICLSRQAAIREMPRIWGLPAAHIEEHSCVGTGDPHCEYHVRWHEQVRIKPIAFGGFIGALAAIAIAYGGAVGISLSWALPILGCLTGYLMELRRTVQANQAFGEETNHSLRDLAKGYADAHEEILLANERERDWARNLERQVAERTDRLQSIVDAAQDLRERDKNELRSVTHDLRSPLTIINVTMLELAELVDPEDEGRREALDDYRVAFAKLERLTKGLLDAAKADRDLVQLNPIQVEVRPLADRLRRRLRAMVHDRDIRVSVFCSREAPEFIETDELLFDRVIDNLLSNAAKYTEHGSIVVELTGKPEMFTVKVLDTGPGIGDEAIERVFQSGETAEEEHLTGSYGFGLPIVVRLLGQIGGKLEVMSKPNVGTTFWAHFPETLPTEVESTPEDELDDIINRVVTIRRISNI